MLVDSNILIYAAQAAHAQLRQFIAEHAPAVSAVSYVEVLGYHQLDDQDRTGPPSSQNTSPVVVSLHQASSIPMVFTCV